MPKERTISVLRREAALRALDINAVDVVQVVITPKDVTVWTVVRNPDGTVQQDILGRPAIATETTPFYTPR